MTHSSNPSAKVADMMADAAQRAADAKSYGDRTGAAYAAAEYRAMARRIERMTRA